MSQATHAPAPAPTTAGSEHKDISTAHCAPAMRVASGGVSTLAPQKGVDVTMAAAAAVPTAPQKVAAMSDGPAPGSAKKTHGLRN
jgi:hypothetical protein